MISLGVPHFMEISDCHWLAQSSLDQSDFQTGPGFKFQSPQPLKRVQASGYEVQQTIHKHIDTELLSSEWPGRQRLIQRTSRCSCRVELVRIPQAQLQLATTISYSLQRQSPVSTSSRCSHILVFRKGSLPTLPHASFLIQIA